ncbi:MFS transporter [Cellulophaga omnivescoria]|uniref:MFS transporter n=1 Tax=Cellulophaga omnivescoria TaxID=1888890 RepID=UPI0022F134A7|nr:MFS transporter [Cellulophaga omnivescoria]WBU88726.1 MFS transporter [Cellulophaga omnivescoria]WKB80701.1 MFS transporter [Cellulophaga lytica]
MSQFACTSLWFAGNAIVDDLALKTGLGNGIVGYVLSSVQLGFIFGTLVFALLMIADRFSPSKVFAICALLAALCNFSLLANNITKWHILGARFGTGFFLAGIYPVGMKIAADYYKNGLGKALGYLVGALVLGTAFPFLISGLNLGSNYQTILKTTSFLALLGGAIVVVLVPNGPFRKPSAKLQIKAGLRLFKNTNFYKSAIGYFGHMWELYAFWAFTPLALKTINTIQNTNYSVPIFTFIVIALGAVSCAIGGTLSKKYGSYKIAIVSLFISGIFCIISPLLFTIPTVFFCIGWCIWGMAVTADSPQFSSLVAQSAPAELKGTALTVVNSIGFAISILSIQLLSYLSTNISIPLIFLFLGIGPAIGLYTLLSKKYN